jgi:hypothetical protein
VEMKIVILLLDTFAVSYTTLMRGTYLLPHLTEWARSNTLFSDCISPASYTLPAIPSILTSLTPAHHPIKILENPDYGIPDYVPTIMSVFHDNGFETQLISDSKYPFASIKVDSIDRIISLERHNTSRASDLGWLGKSIVRHVNTVGDPSISFIHILAAHGPCGRNWWDDYIREHYHNAGSRDERITAAQYLLDEYMKRLVQIDEEVIAPLVSEVDGHIVIISDHGATFNSQALGHGFASFHTIQSLFAMSSSLPHVYTHPVTLVDLFPTLCDMYSIQVPSRIDGLSLLPFIGSNTYMDRYIYTWCSDSQIISRGLKCAMVIDSHLSERWYTNAKLCLMDSLGTDMYTLLLDRSVYDPDVTSNSFGEKDLKRLYIDRHAWPMVDYINWYSGHLSNQHYSEFDHHEMYGIAESERGTRLEDGTLTH